MNRLAVITGASSGIGKAILAEYQDEDCMWLVVGRTQPEYCSCRARFVERDLSSLPEVLGAVADIEEFCALEGGQLDLLINNAGGAIPSACESIAPGQVARDVTLNLIAPIQLACAVYKIFREQGRGTIINWCCPELPDR